MSGRRKACFAVTACAACFYAAAAVVPLSAAADEGPDNPPNSSPAGEPQQLQAVQVIGTAPLPGTGIDRDRVPRHTQEFYASDLSREGSASVISAMKDQAASVSINDNLDDAFQPDILYRGFEASPVLGTPQGIAVYQSGVRINEAFGDAVNWDLVPDFAVRRMDISSSNPVFGLNALGGAVILDMKNGFNHHGLQGEVAAGSFGRRSETLQYGAQYRGYSLYVGGRLFDEDGWRDFSGDHVQQLFADVGRRWSRGSVHASFTGASNRLYGEGTTPAQELAINRSSVFTTPQANLNKLAFLTIDGAFEVNDQISLQAQVYRRAFNQGVANGNATNYTPCTDGSNTLCQGDGTTPLQQGNGASIPDISNGGALPIGENDFEKIGTVTTGGTLQAAGYALTFGRRNDFVFGASVDHSNVEFQSSAEPGVISRTLVVLPSGYFVDTAEGNGFTATPVGLHAHTTAYGIFFSDTLNLAHGLDLTASGRYNNMLVILADQHGAALGGDNRYTRFNPAAGLTYKVWPNLTAYAGYSEGNRAPMAGEIECADPAAPCLLPSSLSADPPTLKQVVSRTTEAGLRGFFTLPSIAQQRFEWELGFYNTNLANDIYGIATSLSTVYFANIGTTRRQGLEASLKYGGRNWRFSGEYSLVEATFRTPFLESSSSNPAADANGNIHVASGDRLPGIPEHQLKIGADYQILPRWWFGGIFSYYSNQYLRGDEANQDSPLKGYAVLNFHSTYRVARNFELFANLSNALDRKYSTFGVYGDPTGVGAPGIPAGAGTNDPGVDNRFYGPAPPIAIYGGLRITLD